MGASVHEESIKREYLLRCCDKMTHVKKSKLSYPTKDLIQQLQEGRNLMGVRAHEESVRREYSLCGCDRMTHVKKSKLASYPTKRFDPTVAGRAKSNGHTRAHEESVRREYSLRGCDKMRHVKKSKLAKDLIQ